MEDAETLMAEGLEPSAASLEEASACEDKAQQPWPQRPCLKQMRVMPWSLGMVSIPQMGAIEKESTDEMFVEAWVGTAAGNQRASFVYLALGLPICVISLLGFVPTVYWRFVTGKWWRDPVNIRSMPLPASLDPVICLHGIIGLGWSLILSILIFTGAACSGESYAHSNFRRRLRMIHVWIGSHSTLLAVAFFGTCFLTLFGGMLAEPMGKGHNSLFVRGVQLFAVFFSALMYYFGLVQALSRNIAAHKDCMIGSALFCLVPIGVPRFVRDLLQRFLGDACNMTSAVEFNFLFCTICATIAWPLVYKLSKRWSSPIMGVLFRALVVVNIVLVAAAAIIARPSLTLEPCLWEALTRVR